MKLSIKDIKFTKIFSSTKRIVLFVVILALFFSLFFIVENIINPNRKEIITASSLMEVVQTSELSTYESVYIGIAEVEGEKREEIEYYVYYESRVYAGLDFQDITIDEIEDNHFVVNLPEIKITDIIVDISTLDFIFIEAEANTNTVVEEAYKMCIEDVENETKQDNAIYDAAQQNAKNVIEALLIPFLSDDEGTVQLDFVFGGEQYDE